MSGRHTIEIVYCPRCGWLLRAAWMAQELLTTFWEDIAATSLLPAREGGVFEIRIDGRTLWSRGETGRFPDIAELKRLARDHIAPGRDLGHLDHHKKESTAMKCFMLYTGSGPLVVLTSHDSATAPAFIDQLKTLGVDRFFAREIPVDLARERYGAHFSLAENNWRESDDLRVLDYNGQRAFQLFRLAELGPEVECERAA